MFAHILMPTDGADHSEPLPEVPAIDIPEFREGSE